MSELFDSKIEDLADLIESSMKKYGKAPAFECFGQTLTFEELERLSGSLASWLQHKSGLVAGDRIIIQLPNINQFPIAVFAALRVGLVVVNTNPLYTPREMLHQFANSGAKGIIILQDLLGKLNEVIDKTRIETVIVTHSHDLISKKLATSQCGISFMEAIAQGETLKLNPRFNKDLDDTCVIQYTGGTTGKSKGACLTHRSILSNVGQFFERIDAKLEEQNEIFVCPLPLYHIYAFVVNMIMLFSKGNLNLLIPNPRDLDALVNSIGDHKITGFSGINTLFVGLCQHSGFKALDFSSLKMTFSGGSALTMHAAQSWQAVTQCTVSEGYGLTEASPVVCMNEPGNEQLASVGRPLIDTKVEIWDRDDTKLAIGEQGQIVVKGPQIMKGYWSLPEDTKRAMSKDGYYRTGDVGEIRPNGCIKIVDRLTDMIIVSGFNVYPNEIEEVLVSHPSINEAAVVGEPDGKSGERVCAYVTVLDRNVEMSTLLDYCREMLTAYKIPKRIIFMESLPKTTVGKILRRELRQT
ncbi:AMP-binding protein [Shewanella sp. D64]|uniref:AMP-binding protein n=1 Tax=unclassified Shewanella TaxID=196818 RepID=UPI0022BA5F82|nr:MULTISPECIES: AMP-binding protein [unclassified Shewanella]MEC4724089.1 AMP-binding protein [Shewanella sp. D64]MEC4736109.1 AMP-binding protein [Shewanella sp. E94]WBJ97947.1 AMP-binding protein [Shewanella sp. MTB7]